jgi:hypothetical protein
MCTVLINIYACGLKCEGKVVLVFQYLAMKMAGNSVRSSGENAPVSFMFNKVLIFIVMYR